MRYCNKTDIEKVRIDIYNKVCIKGFRRIIMKKVIIQKITAVALVLTLTMANMIVLAQGVYATYTEETNHTNHKNVRLDAYFKKEEQTSQTLTAKKEEKPLLYVKIGVNQYGYLKEANIEFENNNYQIEESIDKGEYISQIEAGNIKLNKISNGEEVELAIPVGFEEQDKIDLSYFGRKSKVKLTGSYMDEDGELKTVEGEVEVELNWEADSKVEISQEVEKYIGIEDKVMIQTSLKWGIQENKLPIETGKVSLQVPELKGVKPDSVKIIPVNSTVEFGEENWKYNKETGKIEIEIENKADSEGKVNWSKAEEEYKIIYTYEKAGNIEKTTIALKAEATIKLYNKEETEVKEEKTVEIEEMGEIVSAKEEVTGEINKGYLYANTTYESAYGVKDTVQISETDFAKEIEVKHKTTFVMENATLNAIGSTYYESTMISKAQVEKILGEAGSIEVFDNSGNKLAEINKSAEADENGNIVINYEAGKVSEVVIKIHNAEKEGQLEIRSNKKIKGQTGYSLSNMQAMKALRETVQVISLGKTVEASSEVELKETVTKAEASANVTSLSTVMKNEDVEIRVILKSDSGKYDLYKAPVVEIQLPSQVETLELKSAELLFTDEIKIEKCELYENKDGRKVIRVITSGEQTQYVPEINKGIQLVVKADMELKKTATTSNEEIKIHYTNEKGRNLANNGDLTIGIEVNSPVGIITLNSIKNFNSEVGEVTSIGTQTSVGKLEILTEKKMATNTITVINNNGYTIKNPYILGRFPFEGNKKVSGEELGSNISAIVASQIKGVNIEENAYTVYYSENGEAMANTQGWTKAPEDLSKVKSYMIVLNSGEMAQGEEVVFSYDIEIPEGLNYNKSAYSSYALYYENTETRAVAQTEMVEAPSVGISTGEGPELEAKLTANVENGAEVEEGQIIKYRIEVKNIGKVEAKNVKVTSPVPAGSTYVKQEDGIGYAQYSGIKEFTETKETLAAGATYVAEYEVKVNKRIEEVIVKEDGQKQTTILDAILKTTAKVSADKLEKDITTNEYVNPVVEGNFYIELQSDSALNIVLNEDQTISFTGVIENVATKVQQNTVITDKLPEEFKFERATISKNGKVSTEGVTYKEESHTIYFEIGEVKKEEVVFVNIELKTNKLQNSQTEVKAVHSIAIQSDAMTTAKTSNEVVYTVVAPKLTAKQTSNKEIYVNSGEEIEYYVEIKNEGKGVAKKVKIRDILPEELSYVGLKYKVGNSEEIQISNTLAESSCEINIPKETTAIVTFIAKANALEEEKEIINKIEISSENAGSIEVNSLTHIISKNVEIITPDGDKVKVYSISGTAWKDSNRDGKKDDEEETLSNIEVILVNSDTGEIAKKVSNNELQRTTTKNNGAYSFTEVKEGNYFVVFLYDTGRYTVTEYKKQDVVEMENSDVKNAQITLDGESRIAAVSDTISIKEAGVSGVNLGLIEVSRFELNIDKVVSKMIVQDGNGTKEYTFEESKLAKVDLDSKYINSTNVIVEYKIEVTNTGDISGYAKSVVDYIPKELKFQSELNNDWYIGKDGQAYNKSLENTIIQPGETKEVTLVLTKKMTENGNGVVSNKAEIAESYNEQAISNSAKDSEERKTADIVLGLKTGSEITYIILIITTIGVIGMGAYFVNKKVLSKLH